MSDRYDDPHEWEREEAARARDLDPPDPPEQPTADELHQDELEMARFRKRWLAGQRDDRFD